MFFFFFGLKFNKIEQQLKLYAESLSEKSTNAEKEKI